MPRKKKTDDGDDGESKRDMITRTLVEGRKMEAYAEHRTKEMKACRLCGRICFRKVPVKTIGNVDICIDCLRSLKETLDQLDQWEEQIALEKDMRRQMDDGMGV